MSWILALVTVVGRVSAPACPCKHSQSLEFTFSVNFELSCFLRQLCAMLESCVYCLFIGPGSRSRRRSEQVRPYGLYIFIIPFLWTRPKYITKGILPSRSSLQLLMGLLITGKILLIFSQRLMDLSKLIMYIALPHTTAFLTSPYYEISKNKSCVQVAKLN